MLCLESCTTGWRVSSNTTGDIDGVSRERKRKEGGEVDEDSDTEMIEEDSWSGDTGQNSTMNTSVMLGAFRESNTTRMEFLQLIGRSK